jgi:ATP-dependent DNA ligase
MAFDTRWKNIMKAYPFEEKRLAKWSPPYIVQPKYDGDRCKAYFNTDAGYLLATSEDNPFFSVPHIQEELDRSGLDLTLDGELYNHELCKFGGHELIHSIVSRQVNLHKDYQLMQFHVFDIEMAGSQLDRMVKLETLRNLKLRSIVIAPFWICQSLDDIKHVYDKLLAAGYEGIIIRNINNVYEYKRSTMMMKFKPKKTDTYTIIGYNEEISKDGISKGRLGSVTLSSQFGDTFHVSAGLDSEERARFWSIRDTLAGRTATVHYQHLTEKKIPKGCFDLEIH